MSAVVLNVNDHPAHLYLVSKLLRAAGFQVLEATTGSAALEVARMNEPAVSVIVLDVKLPDLDGLEVCRRLKADALTRDIKVLHSSASSTTTDNKIEGLEAGADGYLTQPFEPRDLIATVQSLVRLHDAEAALAKRNETLEAANRRKDEFLAMLAHELRNPLAAIHLGLPILERFAPRDDIEERARAAMRRQTQLLIQLVDDLLDTARVTQGRIELHRERFDLAHLVVTVSDGLRQRLYAPRSQTLTVRVPDEPVSINGDSARLEQILTNLLDNASKYSDPGSEVTVELAVQGASAVLRVTDAGIGIAPDVLPKVFDLFSQAESSLDRARGGLGIGLTLVKALVELHGGAISASSDGLGRGTTMTVRVPVLPEERAAPPSAVEQPADDGGFRIVVVDDNEDGRFLLRSLCELHGHQVVEAADGLSGVERTCEVAPDIAFVDIGLPGIDGYEVARRVRECLRDQGPYLVALSGYGSREHRDAAFAAGFDEHIAKPMQLEQLHAALARARDRRI